MKNLKDILLERLVLTKRESFNHTFEDIWEMVWNLDFHEYEMEYDDEFFEDFEDLPVINNLPSHWSKFNGWVITYIKATGNRELWDEGPDHEDAIKMLDINLVNPENKRQSNIITVEHDEDYENFITAHDREHIYIALKEQI